MSTNTTLGETWRRLRANGYAPTSAKNPKRVISQNFGHVATAHWNNLGDDEAATLCYPQPDNGARDLPNLESRIVAKLSIAASVVRDKRALAGVNTALERFAIGAGPRCVSPYGILVIPLRWEEGLFFDDATITVGDEEPVATIVCANRETSTTELWRDANYVPSRRFTYIGSHVIELAGQWSGGTLLDTPRDRLPRLYKEDVHRLLRAIDEAVSVKEAA